MQIFHWHFKTPQQHQPKGDHSNIHNKEARGDIVEFKESKRDSKTTTRRRERRQLKAFTSLCRQDMATACFYSTLNLKSVHSNTKKEHWIYSMKKQDNVGNKILPVNTATMSNSRSTKIKADNKMKAVSKMKELLRWAAASKSHSKSKFLGTSKGLRLRDKAERKSMKDEKVEENVENERTKTSNRWEVERCSVCSSMASIERLSLNSSPRRGNWITTDSEFVVLEL